MSALARLARALLQVLWLAALAAVVALMVCLEAPAFAGPDAWSPDALISWVEHVGAAAVVINLVRFLAIGAAAYLLLLSVAVAVVRWVRPSAAVALLRWACLPSLRRLVAGGLAAAIPLSTAVPVHAAGGGLAVQILLGRTDVPAATAPAVQVRLPDADAPAEPAPQPVPEPLPPPPPLEPPTTHTVVPGEHYWSIATSVLAQAWGRMPTVDEVARYWRALVAHNRARDATRDPNVLFAGEVLELPPPGAPG